MKEKLTKRQLQVYEYIKRSLLDKGYPPSVREICAAVGLKSSATVHSHLTKLEEKGYIKRDPAKPRAIEILDETFLFNDSEIQKIPIVGRVTAGLPILALENIEEYFPLPTALVKDDTVFMLQVNGDSMVGRGIEDGDYVVVRQQASANNHDIVVALLDNEATVKTFYKMPSAIKLQPENPAYEPIVRDDIKILGKVIALFRNI